MNLLNANDVEEIMDYVYETENDNMIMINSSVFRELSVIRYMLFHTRLICIAEKSSKIDKLFAVLTPENNSPDCSLYLITTYCDEEFVSGSIDVVKEIFGDKYKKIKILSAVPATDSMKSKFTEIGFQLELEIKNAKAQKFVYSRFF